MSRFDSAEEKLSHLAHLEAERRKRFVAKRTAAGLRRVLLWIPDDMLQRLDAEASARGSDRTTLINSLLATGLHRDGNGAQTELATAPKTHVKRSQSTEEAAPTNPAEGLPSRQAAQLLGFASPSALDNAARKAGYRPGFNKNGMKGCCKRAVFLGKAKAEGGGPERSLWRIENLPESSG